MQRNVEKKKFLLEIIFFHREINDETNKIFSYKKTRINIIAIYRYNGIVKPFVSFL